MDLKDLNRTRTAAATAARHAAYVRRQIIKAATLLRQHGYTVIAPTDQEAARADR